MIRKFRLKENGRTAYEDTTGHRVKHWAIGFGDRVQFRFATDNVHNKYEGGWPEGIFVGVVGRPSEYLVFKGDEVYKCFTLRRKPEGEAYTPECLTDARADYFEYLTRGASTSKVVTYKGDAKEGGIPKTIERESQPRSVRIRAEDLKKFGYTAECPGCAWHTGRIGPHR